jgi:hypothetical protein
MEIMFLHHRDDGFVGPVEVEPGTTLRTFLTKQIGGFDSSNCTVRLNRDQVSSFDCVLQDGDKVAVTPSKVTGAL